jgi:hypothetical protein
MKQSAIVATAIGIFLLSIVVVAFEIWLFTAHTTAMFSFLERMVTIEEKVAFVVLYAALALAPVLTGGLGYLIVRKQ